MAVLSQEVDNEQRETIPLLLCSSLLSLPCGWLLLTIQVMEFQCIKVLYVVIKFCL